MLEEQRSFVNFRDFQIFNFPFNLSSVSDTIRHSWFDCYSLKKVAVTKPTDTSKFNLFGVKAYNYAFLTLTKKDASNINYFDDFLLKFFINRNLIKFSKSIGFYFFNQLSRNDKTSESDNASTH